MGRLLRSNTTLVGHHRQIVKNALSRPRGTNMKRRLATQQQQHERREKKLLDTIAKLEKTVEESNVKFEAFRKSVLEEFEVLKSGASGWERPLQAAEDGSESEGYSSPYTDGSQSTSSGISENRKNIEQLDLRLQLHENTAYNGRILWKIDRFQMRRNQVLSGKLNALHSAPSFTHAQLGYKFCLRIYPNGDGVGKGTHLSLFIVLMKSDYDDLLQWPFDHQVKFTLINVDDRTKDITEMMTPNKELASFQKPVGDMNIAAGCPLFIPIGRLDGEGFVQNDSLYIDVEVQQ